MATEEGVLLSLEEAAGAVEPAAAPAQEQVPTPVSKPEARPTPIPAPDRKAAPGESALSGFVKPYARAVGRGAIKGFMFAPDILKAGLGLAGVETPWLAGSKETMQFAGLGERPEGFGPAAVETATEYLVPGGALKGLRKPALALGALSGLAGEAAARSFGEEARGLGELGTTLGVTGTRGVLRTFFPGEQMATAASLAPGEFMRRAKRPFTPTPAQQLRQEAARAPGFTPPVVPAARPDVSEAAEEFGQRAASALAARKAAAAAAYAPTESSASVVVPAGPIWQAWNRVENAAKQTKLGTKYLPADIRDSLDELGLLGKGKKSVSYGDLDIVKKQINASLRDPNVPVKTKEYLSELKVGVQETLENVKAGKAPEVPRELAESMREGDRIWQELKSVFGPLEKQLEVDPAAAVQKVLGPGVRGVQKAQNALKLVKAEPALREPFIDSVLASFEKAVRKDDVIDPAKALAFKRLYSPVVKAFPEVGKQMDEYIKVGNLQQVENFVEKAGRGEIVSGEQLGRELRKILPSIKSTLGSGGQVRLAKLVENIAKHGIELKPTQHALSPSRLAYRLFQIPLRVTDSPAEANRAVAEAVAKAIVDPKEMHRLMDRYGGNVDQAWQDMALLIRSTATAAEPEED